MPSKSNKTQDKPWEAVGISRATYYRRLQLGVAVTKDLSHKKYKRDWIEWRENGLLMRPWSKSHKILQLHYIDKYFAQYQHLSSENLEKALAKIPIEKFSMRKHVHTAVSSFAKYMNYKKLLDEAEYFRIRSLSPKRSPYAPPRQRLITESDLNTLIETAAQVKNQDQALLNTTLLIFLSETGLRVSEACDLLQADIVFSAQPTKACMRVRLGKGGKNRIVPFSRKAQDAVKNLFAQSFNDGKYLFGCFNPRSRCYQKLDRHAVARRFHRLAKKTRIDFSAHSLRHYRITQWANDSRIPIAVVQRWAGHSSLEITQKYIHISDEEALKAAFD